MRHIPSHSLHKHRAAVDEPLQNRDPGLLGSILDPIFSALLGSDTKETTTSSTPTSTASSSTSTSGSSSGSSGAGSSSSSSSGSSGSDSSSSSSSSSGSSSGSSSSGSSSGSSSSGSSGGSSSSDSSSGSSDSDSSSGSSSSGSSSGSSSSDSESGSSSGSSSVGSDTPSKSSSSSATGSPTSAASGSSTTKDPTVGIALADKPDTSSSAVGASPQSSAGSSGDSGNTQAASSQGTGGALKGSSSSTTALRGASTAATSNFGPYSQAGTSITAGGAPSSTSGSASSSKGGGISSGSLAGIIVVLVLLLLALAFILVRRRHKLKRAARNHWWSSGMASGMVWGQGTSSAGTASARSSFATTYDIGSSEVSLDHTHAPEVPALPPMAELRDTHAAGVTINRVPPPPILINIENHDERRSSVQSNRSISSDPYSQLLVVREASNVIHPEIGTPMSVRPFSPSESFAFPQPPSKYYSGVQGDHTSDSFVYPDSPTNPFADVNLSRPVSVRQPQSEIIRRPFAPTLHDELGVEVGEHVHILKAFDDGWALVEKVPAEAMSIGATGKSVLSQPGLIPIDCLREAGESLPAFLAAKRVSSYTSVPLLPSNPFGP